MTGKTSFLDLTTYSYTTDASALFFNFRTNVAGSITSSNFNLIDDFASTITASTIALRVEQPIYTIAGSYAAPNVYGATSTTLIAYETNQVLSLKLDTENDGTVGLRINELDTKTLQKIDNSGESTILESGDLKKNKQYFFKYDGSTFVLAGATVADQVSITGTNNDLVKISGCKIIIDSGTAVSSGSRISGSYIAVQGTANNLQRYADGSAINSGIIVSSGSRISGSFIASLGSTNNLLRHFSGSAIDSGIIVSSGSRISGSYIAAQGTANNLQRYADGSAIDSGIIVSSGSRISGSYISALGSENNLLRHVNGSATDSGIVVSSGSRISGSYIKSGSTLSIVSGSIGLNESGISSGSYKQFEIDTYGRIITGSYSTGIVSIEGSSIMSNTTGSTVKHNASGVVADSYTYSTISIDTFGHILSAISNASGSTRILDWGIDKGSNSWVSSTAASWQATDTSLTLNLSVPGIIIAVGTGRMYSSSGQLAFMKMVIDGTSSQYVHNATTTCATTALIKSCGSGTRVCQLQSYANSTDTVTFQYGNIVAFAIPA